MNLLILNTFRKAIEEGADKVEEAERKKKEEERREAMKNSLVFNNVCIVLHLQMTTPIEEFLDKWFSNGYDAKELKEFELLNCSVG